MSAITDNPRERARALAAQGMLGLGRLLFATAIFEAVVAIVRAILAPDDAPIVLVHFAAVARAGIAFGGAFMARRLSRYARALGFEAWSLAAVFFFALSGAASLLPLFSLVPEALGDAVWDALLQVLRVATLVAGAASGLLVARAFAERESLRFIARHLTWTVMPLIVCLPVALQAIDAALVPSAWTAPALALLLPWAMVPVRLMRWDMAAWTTLATLAALGAVSFGHEPAAMTLTAVALVAVLLLAAIAVSGALHELAPQLGPLVSETTSRTLIRRLFEGTLGGEGSRVGDIDVEGTPVDEQAEEAEHLARVYRELGIGPPQKAGAPPEAGQAAPAQAPDAAPAQTPPIELPRDIAPLVPISRQAPRPREAEIIPLPGAFASIHVGLRWCFAAIVARVLVATFGLLWASSPFADMAFAQVLFDLALLASAVPLAVGLSRMRTSPLPATRRLATASFVLALALVLADLALAVARLLAAGLRPALLGIDGIIGVAAIITMLGTLARMFTHIHQPRLAARARNLGAMLVAWSALAAATVIVDQLPESDLRWLGWPLGFAAAVGGLGLWIALLWLVRDSQEATEPHAR